MERIRAKTRGVYSYIVYDRIDPLAKRAQRMLIIIKSHKRLFRLHSSKRDLCFFGSCFLSPPVGVCWTGLYSLLYLRPWLRLRCSCCYCFFLLSLLFVYNPQIPISSPPISQHCIEVLSPSLLLPLHLFRRARTLPRRGWHAYVCDPSIPFIDDDICFLSLPSTH